MICYYILDDEGENPWGQKITDFAVTTDTDGDQYVYNKHDEATKNYQDDDSKIEHRIWEMKGIFNGTFSVILLWIKIKQKLRST